MTLAAADTRHLEARRTPPALRLLVGLRVVGAAGLVGAGLLAVGRFGGAGAVALIVFALPLAVLHAGLALALWRRKLWAWRGLLALTVLGLLATWMGLVTGHGRYSDLLPLLWGVADLILLAATADLFKPATAAPTR